MIIFLNGGSSAGKSSLAREIMSKSAIPFCYFSIDHLVNYWMDEKFVALSSENPEPWKKDWFFHIEDNDNQGNKVVKISDGSRAKKLHHDMIKAWGFLAQQGHSLIIDEAIWRKEIFWWYLEEFSAITPIYLIKVKCDLAVAIAREQARENRFIGLARGLKEVEKNIDFYDLEIDTTNSTPRKSAEEILKFIRTNPWPASFQNNFVAEHEKSKKPKN